jgi:hypothetical protein
MKTIILIILIFASSLSFGQVDWKRIAIKSTFITFSGACDGTAETLKFHYAQFGKVFPKASKQFCDPSVSWQNKYKGGDPANGSKFPGSTGLLVGATDLYHLMRMVRNTTMIVGLTIDIGSPLKKWYVYVIEGVCYYIAYTGGFNLSYDIIF